jgi:TonB family protein
MTLRFFLAILLVSFVFLLSDHAKAFSDTSDFIDKIKQDMASDKPLDYPYLYQEFSTKYIVVGGRSRDQRNLYALVGQIQKRSLADTNKSLKAKIEFAILGIKSEYVNREYKKAVRLFDAITSEINKSNTPLDIDDQYQLQMLYLYSLAAYRLLDDQESVQLLCDKLMNLKSAKTEKVKALFRMRPKYPKKYADKGISGTVKMHINIDECGKVTDAETIEGKDRRPRFSKSVMKTIDKFVFQPKLIDGKTQASNRVELVFTFDYTSYADTYSIDSSYFNFGDRVIPRISAPQDNRQ